MRDRFLKIFSPAVTIAVCLLSGLSGCGSAESPEVPAEKPAVVDDSTSHSINLQQTDTAESEKFSDMPTISLENEDSLANHTASSSQPESSEAMPQLGLNDAELAEIGIEVFESPRLKLLVDQVKPATRDELTAIPLLLGDYFDWIQRTYPAFLEGVDASAWTWTGYVMREPALFRQAGLLPEELADLSHGRDRGREFWMIEQPTPYYRRHLLLHEATHCVMNERFHQWPVWYLEGMAELLACHAVSAGERPQFAVTPGKVQVAGGFGRIALLRSEVAAGRFRSLSDVLQLDFDNFYPHKTSYAWAWAVCYFLSEHPATADKFQRLSRFRTNPEFSRSLDAILKEGGVSLQRDWAAFITSLAPGFDLSRMLVRDATAEDSSHGWELRIDHSWQVSPYVVQAGASYTVTANGEFTLASQPEPWVSGPWGVSIAYVDGRPRGELQMAVVAEQDSGWRELAAPQPVGGKQTFVANQAGRLLFRVNERADDWANNSGRVVIRLSPASATNSTAGE